MEVTNELGNGISGETSAGGCSPSSTGSVSKIVSNKATRGSSAGWSSSGEAIVGSDSADSSTEGLPGSDSLGSEDSGMMGSVFGATMRSGEGLVSTESRSGSGLG